MSSNNNSSILTPPTDNDITTEKAPLMFSSIRIDDDVWNQRIQDKGCTFDELPSKTYQQNKIVSVGPNEENLQYFYDLSSICIDYIKNITMDPTNKVSWTRFPKNRSDIKENVVKHIIEQRQLGSNGVYILDQTMILQVMHKQWGPK